MGSKYPKIKLELNSEEQNKLNTLKRLKKFNSLPETFHYLLHSKTVFGKSDNIREELKRIFSETSMAESSFWEDTSEETERFLISLHAELQKIVKTENEGKKTYDFSCEAGEVTGNKNRKTYDIFPDDRDFVGEIKEKAKSIFGKIVSDTDVFKILLSRLNIADELSDGDCKQLLEEFRKKMDEVVSLCYDAKENFFIDAVVEKYNRELAREGKDAAWYTDEISAVELHIENVMDQIDAALEKINKIL